MLLYDVQGAYQPSAGGSTVRGCRLSLSFGSAAADISLNISSCISTGRSAT